MLFSKTTHLQFVCGPIKSLSYLHFFPETFLIDFQLNRMHRLTSVKQCNGERDNSEFEQANACSISEFYKIPKILVPVEYENCEMIFDQRVYVFLSV